MNKCFIQPEGKINLLNREFFSFCLNHNTNNDKYFCEEEDKYLELLSKLTSSLNIINPFDSYHSIEAIGQGKFSIVHRVQNKFSKEFFAMKIIKKQKMGATDIESTRREIAILNICEHQNIINLKDYYKNYDNIFISN